MSRYVSGLLLALHVVACGNTGRSQTGTASNRDPAKRDASVADASAQGDGVDSGTVSATTGVSESTSAVTSEATADNTTSSVTLPSDDTSVGEVFTGIGVGAQAPIGEITEGPLFNPGPAEPDERPVHEPWVPDVLIGEPGWKDSVGSLCLPFSAPGSGSTSVWADERGVSLLRTGTCERALEPGCPSKASALYFNDGTGWTNVMLSQADPSRPALVGVLADGVTVALSIGSLVMIQPDGTLKAFRDTELANIHSAFLVPGTELIYTAGIPSLASVSGDQVLTGLGQLQRSTARALWAGQKRAYLAGDGNVFAEYDVREGRLNQVSTVPVGDYTAVWGIEEGAEDEVWLGNWAAELLHRVDGTWEVISTELTGPIQKIWGAGPVVYFHTPYVLGRVTPNGLEILASFPVEDGISVQAVWGTTATEVFVVFNNAAHEKYACGGLFVTWFDGEMFHRF